jgi:hypothetical protein
MDAKAKRFIALCLGIGGLCAVIRILVTLSA